MNFEKNLKIIISKFEKSNIWFKILLILGVLLVVLFYLNINKKQIEGLDNISNKKFIEKTTPQDIFDETYSNIYDELTMKVIKSDYQMGEIINKVNNKKNDKILDIGSGTGHHVGVLKNMGYNTRGLDISKPMVEKAKEYYNNSEYDVGDALDTLKYHENEFSIISCFNLTVYYIENKKILFENCFKWLKPGGLLLLNLVDRDNFDTLLPISNPIKIINIQEYSKKRITKSVAKLDDFNYKSEFIPVDKDNIAFFEETLTDKNNNIRKNKHKLFMNKQEQILSIAKETGFKLDNTIDFKDIKTNYEYIYVLKKPL
jgi:SAM-dependent methyltransferase